MMNHVKQSNVQAVLAVCVGLVLAMGGLAQADLVAYDGFDYGDSGDLHGSNGGSGNWTSTWADGGDGSWGFNLDTPGLTYTGLPVVGNTSTTNGGDGSYRTVDDTGLLDEGDNVWFSVLVRDDGTGSDLRVNFFGTASAREYDGAGFNFAGANGGTHSISAEYNGGNWGSSDTGVTDGDTLLVVGKIAMAVDDGTDPRDYIRIWVNPSLDSEPLDGDATSSYGVKLSDGGFAFPGEAVNLRSGGSFEGAVDEIRIGTTFNDVVVPEPATLGLLGLGGLAVLRRRRA